MARRSRDWNVGLAENLDPREFVREFLLVSIGQGVPLQVALGKVVRTMELSLAPISDRSKRRRAA